jgi:hypothetical protein
MRTALALLVYAAVLGFGLFQTFRPTWTSGFARVQTERGDGMLNHYILEHSWQCISNPAYPGSLSSPPCFYPQQHTLWYSEHLLGVAPLYWGLRLALPYDLAYQWWQIILQALNFASFALVMRWLRGPHSLAILGGYLWAFSLINIDQIKHQQMIPRFAMVLAAYHGWQFIASFGMRNAESQPETPTQDESSSSHSALRAPRSALHLNRMLAAVFLQAITCVNTAWFLVTGLGTFLVLAVVLCPGVWRNLLQFVWTHFGRVSRIVGGWAGVLVAAYVPYFLVNWGHARPYGACVELMPSWESWLAAVPGSVWEPVVGEFRTRSHSECLLFCGFGLYLLMFTALGAMLVSSRRRLTPDYGLALAGLVTSLLWFAFTLKIGFDDSLWVLVRHIPGGTAIRCVSRVYVSVYLFGVLGALVWLSRVTEHLRPAARTLLLGGITVLCIVEQYGYDPPSFEKQDFYGIVDRTATDLSKGDIGYFIQRYTDSKGVCLGTVYGEMLGMWAGMRANVPIVNGYSGRLPDHVYRDLESADGPERKVELRRWLTGKFRGKVVMISPDDPGATEIIEIE